MAVKAYNFHGLAGCVSQFRSQATGTLVGHYHGEQAGLEDDPENPWVCVCETHHTLVTVPTQALMRSIRDPREFCEECREKNKTLKCSCCGATFSRSEWDGLSYVGIQEFPGVRLELRNCMCNSTLSRELPEEASHPEL